MMGYSFWFWASMSCCGARRLVLRAEEEPQLDEAAVEAVACCSILKSSTDLVRSSIDLVRSSTLTRRLLGEAETLHILSDLCRAIIEVIIWCPSRMCSRY